MTPRCETHNCGERTVERMDALGRIAWECRACKRNAAGLCRDCPAPLTKRRALRCPACSLAQKQKRDRRLKAAQYRSPGKRLKIIAAKRRSAAKPDVHARQIERNKRWREANPRVRTDADRLYNRLYMRQYRAVLHPSDPR